jgi:hypothetical protein
MGAGQKNAKVYTTIEMNHESSVCEKLKNVVNLPMRRGKHASQFLEREKKGGEREREREE